MKALSIRQPWGFAIMCGTKRVENRTRNTNFRGLVAIHASAKWDRSALQDPRWLRTAAAAGEVISPGWPGLTTVQLLCESGLPTGAILGTAVITGSHRADGCCEPWGNPDVWHWTLDDVRPIQPVSCKGRLGFWTVPDEIAQALP